MLTFMPHGLFLLYVLVWAVAATVYLSHIIFKKFRKNKPLTLNGIGLALSIVMFLSGIVWVLLKLHPQSGPCSTRDSALFIELRD